MPKLAAKSKAKSSTTPKGKMSSPAKFKAAATVDIRSDKWSRAWQEVITFAGSSAKLAEELDVSHMKIHRWASGEYEPSKLERLGLQTWCQVRGLVSPV